MCELQQTMLLIRMTHDMHGALYLGTPRCGAAARVICLSVCVSVRCSASLTVSHRVARHTVTFSFGLKILLIPVLCENSLT